MSERLLELRKKMNAKRPNFSREDYNKKKRIKHNNKWRKPKGIHSKSRHSFRGNFALVKTGYRNPKAVRNLDSAGLIPILIHNLNDLKNINAENQCAIIANIGVKKRIVLLKECKNRNIKVLNFKNIDVVLKAVEDKIVKKNEAKKVKAESKAKAKKSLKEKIKKKAEKKKAEKQEEKGDEDKKKEERKDMEKILTKRGTE